MKAYHGSEEVKAKYVARSAAHRAADEVVQGQGFANGRGCFVGCTLDKYDHSQFPVELGWPEWLAHLADMIFENLPKAEALQFGTDILEAVVPGADLEAVRVPFLVSIQQRNLVRLEGSTEPYAVQCRAAIQSAIDFLLTGEPAAESAAWSAAESAAWSARSARSVESKAQRDTILQLIEECK